MPVDSWNTKQTRFYFLACELRILLSTGEWKIDSPKGFVAADSRVKIDNIDSFLIEFNFDSDKIKHRKIHAEIGTKLAVKSGKRILVTVTSDGKNIVTGR